VSEQWDSLLDGSKIAYHEDRVRAYERGERIAPITIDMALTRNCNFACGFCAAQYQENDRKEITHATMDRFLRDCAELGVRGISLVSDGESSISPVFAYTINLGKHLGIDMAVGSNAFVIDRKMSEEILPHLTYLRINFSGGTKERYAQIMGVKPSSYDRVVQNIRDMVAVKRERGLSVTIGIQMVLQPQDADQIIPFAALGRDLGVDYAVIKHCSDTPEGFLGVDYSKYAALEDLLRQAEALSTDDYKCVIKWNKIRAGKLRSYQRCMGPPFLLQISGSGLVAPCGGTFNDAWRKFHMGNIVDTSFKEIVQSDRYWEVIRHLSSEEFDASKSCDALCLQDLTNRALDGHMNKGVPIQFKTGNIAHRSFI
jgi:MoaA/NifB/PqqE/SkfB family radical SAM enzyme